MSTTHALLPQDWQAARIDSPSRQWVWLIALLLSIALHGMLWSQLRRVESFPRGDLPDKAVPVFITIRIAPKVALPAPDPDEAAPIIVPSPPQAVDEPRASLPDPPPQIAPAARPHLPLHEPLSKVKPTDAPQGNFNFKSGAGFDSDLRRELDKLKSELPIPIPENRVNFDNYGEEWIRHGDSCFKVVEAIDHQDQAQVGIATTCKGASRENDFEREFRARLRARGLK